MGWLILLIAFHAQASRAQILKKATDYITSMRMKNLKHQGDIDAMRQQNKAMEDEGECRGQTADALSNS